MGLTVRRRVGETVVLRVPADRAEYVEIDVTVAKGGTNGGAVTLFIEAPDEVDIRREEIA
jgi:sRNA-binding carbon storage regulator CsrA